MFTHLMKTYQGRNVMSIKFCISAKNLSRLLTTPAGHSDFNGQTCAVPTRVYKGLSGARCLQIACGSSHTLFLTDMV